MWIRLSAAGDDGRERVELRLQRAQRGDRRGARLRIAGVRAVDDHHRAAGQERRQLGQRREVQDPERGGQLVRRVRGQRVPGAQHLGVALVRPQQHPREDLVVREQRELHRGHDAEVPAAAAQRPEQVGVDVGGRADELRVRRDQLDRGHGVGGEPVAAGEPAQAAAERVADDADVGRGAREREQPVRGRRLGDLEPQRAGLDAGGPRLDVDLDAAHPLGGEQDRPLQRAERGRVVAGALRGDLQAGADRVLEHGLDVGGVGREGDERGPLVDGQVPGAAREVPLGVVGRDDVAGEGGKGLDRVHAAMLDHQPPARIRGNPSPAPAAVSRARRHGRAAPAPPRPGCAGPAGRSRPARTGRRSAGPPRPSRGA